MMAMSTGSCSRSMVSGQLRKAPSPNEMLAYARIWGPAHLNLDLDLYLDLDLDLDLDLEVFVSLVVFAVAKTLNRIITHQRLAPVAVPPPGCQFGRWHAPQGFCCFLVQICHQAGKHPRDEAGLRSEWCGVNSGMEICVNFQGDLSEAGNWMEEEGVIYCCGLSTSFIQCGHMSTYELSSPHAIFVLRCTPDGGTASLSGGGH